MNPKLVRYILLTIVSLSVSALGINVHHFRMLSLILGAPGLMLGVLLSPYGAEGGIEVDAVAFITNFIFYFLLLRSVVVRRLFRSSRETSKSSQ